MPMYTSNSSNCRANEVIEEVVKKWGKVDILVNNAGITRMGLSQMTEDQWDQAIETNLKGIFNYSKAMAGHMKIQMGKLLIWDPL